MTTTLGTPNPAAPVAPTMTLAEWQRVIAHTMQSGWADDLIRKSVAKRVARARDSDDDMEAYALGRSLECLAREEGDSELGRFLLEQARLCGSGMQDRDLGKGAK